MSTMQVNVPVSTVSGENHFIPKPIQEWMRQHGLDYRLVSQSSWGCRERCEAHYLISNVQEEDATVFRLHFPECTVWFCK